MSIYRLAAVGLPAQVFSTSPDSGYRAVSFEDDKNFMKPLQKAIAPGIPQAAWDSHGKSGWFFAMPDNVSKQMIKTDSMPVGAVINGSVINLNPCCFGESVTGRSPRTAQ
jgi:hypothetical protein